MPTYKYYSDFIEGCETDYNISNEYGFYYRNSTLNRRFITRPMEVIVYLMDVNGGVEGLQLKIRILYDSYHFKWPLTSEEFEEMRLECLVYNIVGIKALRMFMNPVINYFDNWAKRFNIS